jgi:hypothetical protein
MRAAAAAAAAVAVATAGCGGSDEDRVRDTVTAFRDATAHRDYDRICDDVLAPALSNRLAALGLPCEVAVSRFLRRTREPRIAVRRVTISGDRARAVVRSSAAGQRPSRDVLRLVRTGDGWRISSLGS